MRTIVHIGTPKTAATSLQTAYFPAVAAENPGFVYAGLLQPRRRRQSELHAAFREALDEDRREARLTEALAHVPAEAVIVSDPHVLGDRPGPGPSWKTKVARLGRALAGHDHTVVVTVRDPIDAAFSYFVDLSCSLPRRKRNFLSQVGSEAFEVFRYARLFAVLQAHFDPARIAVVGYDDIVCGRLETMDAALGVTPRERTLPHLRRRHRIGSAIRTDRLSVEQSLAYCLPSCAAGVTRSAMARLPDRLRYARVGPHLLVSHPTPVEAARLAQFYAPHVAFLRERYGIEDRRSLNGYGSSIPAAARAGDPGRIRPEPLGADHAVHTI